MNLIRTHFSVMMVWYAALALVCILICSPLITLRGLHVGLSNRSSLIVKVNVGRINVADTLVVNKHERQVLYALFSR